MSKRSLQLTTIRRRLWLPLGRRTSLNHRGDLGARTISHTCMLSLRTMFPEKTTLSPASFCKSTSTQFQSICMITRKAQRAHKSAHRPQKISAKSAAQKRSLPPVRNAIRRATSTGRVSTPGLWPKSTQAKERSKPTLSLLQSTSVLMATTSSKS